jgi:hypothetical protein
VGIASDIRIRNVSDLRADVRAALEVLLERKLAEDEQVSVVALSPHPAPSGDARQAAARRLSETLKVMDESARAAPREELEALIDEAVDRLRGRRS